MKKYQCILIFVTFSHFLYGQNGSLNLYNSELKRLANEISNRIVAKGKKKVAVWDFTDISGEVGALGQYTAEKISIHLTNAGGDYQMIDRQHLETIRKELKMKANGSIAPNTNSEEGTKILGQFLGADAIVTGKISIFGTYCDISVKVLDATTAALIVASDGEVQIDDRMRDFLGVPRNTSNPNDIGIDKNSIRGSMGSNELMNSNKSQNTKCNEKKIADYCFRNNSDSQLQIILTPYYRDKESGYLHSGETSKLILSQRLQQCFYNLEVERFSNFKYKILTDINSSYRLDSNILEGNFALNPCESKTYVIEQYMIPQNKK
jgi:hypothetical protein